MSRDPASLFIRMAPVLNVPDVAAERAFCERLGLPVIYEGPECPDFIGFGTETVHFGIQKSPAANDPPSVLTWQIGVTDIDSAINRCRSVSASSWKRTIRRRGGATGGCSFAPRVATDPPWRDPANKKPGPARGGQAC
jgi:hypothetical protein